MINTQEFTCVTVMMRVKEGCEQEFCAYQIELQHRYLSHKGIIEHNFHRCEDEPNLYLFYERYESEEALEAHNKSQEVADWIPVRDRIVEYRQFHVWKRVQQISTVNN